MHPPAVGDADESSNPADPFAGYDEDSWQTHGQVLALPSSRTGLGLDQPLRVVLTSSPETPADRRRVDAHVEAEVLAAARLVAAWVLHQHGSEAPFNGQPVGEYLEKFRIYEPQP